MTADPIKTAIWAAVKRLYPHSIFLLIALAIHLPLLTTEFDFYSGDASDLIPFVFGTKQLQYNTFQQLLEIPFWNPYIFLGQPTVGNIQYTLFYPLNALFLIFQFFTALAMCQILHMAIAGIGTYLLARHLGCGKTGGILSGVLFMLNGRILYYIHAGWIGYFCSICWIPLFILSSLNVIKKQKRHLMVVFGAVFAMTLLAGTPQYAFFGGCLFLVHGAFASITAKTRSSRYRILYGVLVSGLIGILLTGVQLLPSAEQTYLSSRVLFDSTHSGFHFSWDLQQWFRLLFRPEILRHDFSWELCAYIGVGGILIAFMGVAMRYANRSFLIIWGGAPLLASMGAAFPPMEAVLSNVPGLAMLSNPSRYFIFTIIALCVSAGFGFEALTNIQTSNGKGKKILCLFIASVLLTVLAYWTPLYESNATPPNKNLRLFAALFVFLLLAAAWLGYRKTWLKTLLVFWLILDPILIAPDILTVYDFDKIKLPEKILQEIKRHPGPARVATLQPRRLWGSRLTPIDDWTFVQEKISRVGGYDPLAMRDTLTFLTRLEGSSPTLQSSMWAFRLWGFGNPGLFNMAGVTHVVSLEPLAYPGLEFVIKDTVSMPDFQGGRWENAPLYLYKNQKALPRSFFIKNKRIPKGYFLQYQRISPDVMVLRIETHDPGTVVVAESFHPGWVATLKTGEIIKLKPYRDALLSFEVNSGRREIRLEFSPESYRSGLRLTWIGLILSLFMLFMQRREDVGRRS